MIDYRENAIWSVYVHIVPKEISDYDYDKYYVGITSQKPEKRWGKNGTHYRNLKRNYFYLAIQKYDWDNIQHEIIAEHLTEEEAKAMEIKLINVLQSNGKYGYNLTHGGDGSFGCTPHNIKRIHQFDLNGLYIRSFYDCKEVCEICNTSPRKVRWAADHRNELLNSFFSIVSNGPEKTAFRIS